MIDEGRLERISHRGPADRTDDPAGDAARAFAEALEKAGVQVTGAPREARAADEARTVATHCSAPLSALAERTLTNSDNDIAEALARQTAIAKGEKASFAGARRAVTNELEEAPAPGRRRQLRRRQRPRPQGPRHPRPPHRPPRPRRLPTPTAPDCAPFSTGLPIAGFSGTLDGRYERDAAGTGLVRAKTGTLRGVNSLAGTVVDRQGRLLAFAFLASGSTSAAGAEPALDALATALAGVLSRLRTRRAAQTPPPGDRLTYG
ncbi:D-alanyl-D-alanine carboxypeptidase/D-alanyl-D-alanine-endopeptidase [Streptomyces californicus]